MRRFLGILGAGAISCWVACLASADAQQRPPSVVVMNFSTDSLSNDWYGGFQPGAAISDLVTNELITAGTYNVVDRARLSDTMKQHQMATSGSLDAQSASQAGRLVGARFLIEGDVLQFDQSTSGTNVGGVISSYLGGPSGGYHRTRVTIRVAVRVVNTQTGQVVQGFDDQQAQVATSWNMSSWTYVGYGDYESSQFTSSTIGHLMDAAAKDIVSKIDTRKLIALQATMPAMLTGRIIATDAGNFILNVGSSRGVSVGQYFAVSKVMQVRDPGSGRYLTVNEPTGRIQVTSVSGDTAIARKVSGKPAKGQQIKSEQP